MSATWPYLTYFPPAFSCQFVGLKPALLAMSNLPPSVHISRHPCLRAKLSQLRSKSRNARETKELVHEISLILGTEALAGLDVATDGVVRLPPSSGLLADSTTTGRESHWIPV